MAESSIGWTTDGTGDGTLTGYTMAQFLNWIQLLVMDDNDEDEYGVVYGYANGLAVTATGTNHLQVDTGGAFVIGLPYWNTAAVDLTVTTPVVDTTGWRVVLRADWTAQTVRATVIESADGTAAIPALTQTEAVTWDIPLAQGTITVGNAITIASDDRKYIQGTARWDATTVGRNRMADGWFVAATVLAKFAENSFTTANLRWLIPANNITNAALLDVVLDGAFQNDAATRALFADAIWSLAKIANGTACSVVGRSANSAGVYADMAAGTNGHVLRRSGNVVGFGTIGADSLAASIDAQPIAFNADSVDGWHAAGLVAGSVIVGAIVLWSGPLGGSDGHRPVWWGVANEAWHLCNGEMVGSEQTPDLPPYYGLYYIMKIA